MKRAILLFTAASVAAILVGVTVVILFVLLMPVMEGHFVSFEDASGDPRYSNLVGRDLRSTEALVIHGISVAPDYAPILDHYTVTRPAGIGGREVPSLRGLAAGTTVHVLKIMRCTDCYFDFGLRVHGTRLRAEAGGEGGTERQGVRRTRPGLRAGLESAQW